MSDDSEITPGRRSSDPPLDSSSEARPRNATRVRIRTRNARTTAVFLLALAMGAVALLALAAHGAVPEIGPLWLVWLAVFYPPVLRLGMLRANPVRMEVPVLLLWVSIAVALSLGGEGGVALGWMTVVLGLSAAWDRKVDAALLIVAAVATPLVASITRTELLITMPIFLLVGVITAVLVHGRESERRVGATGASGRNAGAGFAEPASPPRGSNRSRRVVFGLVLAGIPLSASLMLLSLLVLKGEMSVLDRVEAWRAEAQGPTDPLDLKPWEGRSRSSGASPRDTRFSFGGDLSSSGKRRDGEDVRLLRIQLHHRTEGRTIRDGRPFLLRAAVVDRVTQEGFIAAEEDGPQSWKVDRSGLAILSPSEGDLELRCVGQDPIRYGRYRSLLLGIEPRLAVRLGYDAEGPLGEVARPRPGVLAVRYCPNQLEYAVMSRLDRMDHAYLVGDRGRARLRQRRARHEDSRYTELIPGDVFGLVDRAGVAVSRASDDLSRVLGVTESLKQGFTYDRTIAFQGSWSDVQALVESGKGLCSHFAAAALVMLRSLGIPCRIATGFLVKDYDNDTRAYGVWESNAHAWIEVFFDDYGWVPFDVTPPTALEDLLSGTLANEESEDLPVESDLVAEVSQDVAEFLNDVYAAIGRAGSSSALRNGVFLLVIFGVLAAWWTTRRPRLPMGGVSGLPRAERARYERLFLALEQLGFHRRRGQTPKELVSLVAAHGGSDLEPLPSVVDWFYRSRFGGRNLTTEEASEIDALIASLEERAAKPSA